MRRPLSARKALGFSPLVKAGWAHSSRVERVSFMSAGARPTVLLSGRPAAEWASDVRAGGDLLVLKLAIWNDDPRPIVIELHSLIDGYLDLTHRILDI